MYPSWAVSIRVCILPARVGCLPKSLVAIEFSQHRRSSFRLVIISLHIWPTAQTRAQRMHLVPTLRTPPAHTHTGCGQPTASYNVRLNITNTTSQACGGKTACCCGSAGRKGSRQSEANERGCCQAQRPVCFPESIRFLFIHIKPAGWRHVRGVDVWVTGGSRAQVNVFAEEK